LAGKWVRNGLQIKGQAMTYIQANFCNSMADMDLFFLQICATNLPQYFFLVLKRSALSQCVCIGVCCARWKYNTKNKKKIAD